MLRGFRINKTISLAVATYVGVAVLVVGVTGAVNLPKYIRLLHDGRAVDATVVRTECDNHSLVVARFEVSGKSFRAEGTGGYRNPECTALSDGDDVVVYYLPTKPSVNVIGDIHERWSNEITSIGIGTVLLPLVAALAVASKGKSNKQV